LLLTALKVPNRYLENLEFDSDFVMNFAFFELEILLDRKLM